MLRKRRSLRKSLLVLLALLMVLTVAQLGPASAADFGCTPHWGERRFVTGGPLDIIERCEPVLTIGGDTVWDWVFLRFALANQDKRTIWSGGASSPPYKMVLNALIGGGSGGGAGAAKVILYNPSGSHLTRRIAARALVEYQPTGSSGWYTCHDTGYKERESYAMRAYVWQYTQPDCGPAYYRTKAAGRFWSISLNAWVTRGWITSPSLWITYGTGPVEAESRPTTPSPNTP
jgi:hypothetical protein